jgi:hypothetical protein
VLITPLLDPWMLKTAPIAKCWRDRQPWCLSADNCTGGTHKGIPELSFDKASKPPDPLLPELKIAWSTRESNWSVSWKVLTLILH